MISTRTGIKVTAAALGLAVTSAVAACGTTGPAPAANKAAVSTGPLQAPNLTYGQQSCGYVANFHDGSSTVILLGWQRDCAQAASWLDKDGAPWHQEDPVTAGSTQGYSYCDLNGPAGENLGVTAVGGGYDPLGDSTAKLVCSVFQKSGWEETGA